MEVTTVYLFIYTPLLFSAPRLARERPCRAQGTSPFAQGRMPPSSATLFAERLDIPLTISRWFRRPYRQCGAPKCSGSNGFVCESNGSARAPKCSGSNGFACESNGSAPLRAPPQEQRGRSELRGATGREQPAFATHYMFITHSPLATTPAVVDRP